MILVKLPLDIIRLVDAVILTTLAFAIAWMGVSHTRMKRKEKRIRNAMYEELGQLGESEFRLGLKQGDRSSDY